MAIVLFPDREQPKSLEELNFRGMGQIRENRENYAPRKFGATVEPLYNGHRWGPKFCPLQLRGFRYISSRRGMHNRAAWLRFQSYPLLYTGREC